MFFFSLNIFSSKLHVPFHVFSYLLKKFWDSYQTDIGLRIYYLCPLIFSHISHLCYFFFYNLGYFLNFTFQMTCLLFTVLCSLPITFLTWAIMLFNFQEPFLVSWFLLFLYIVVSSFFMDTMSCISRWFKNFKIFLFSLNYLFSLESSWSKSWSSCFMLPAILK